MPPVKNWLLFRNYKHNKMQSSLSELWLQRFGGIGRLYGVESLHALARAHMVIAGIGGVGTWTAESLARSGIGTITLIDLDDVCITNSNRQVHALQSTIGQSKTTVMAERLREINPEIIVHEIEDFVTPDNTLEMIKKEAHDVVIDATDTANAKSSLIAHCRRNKIPIITVGSAGGKRDPRQVTSADLTLTTNDPLLAKVRNQLRRLHNFPRSTKKRFSVQAVYSEEQMLYPTPEGGICQSKNVMEGGVKLDCSGGFGAASMITGTFGMIAASRAIEIYLRKNNDLI
jgi:tRNA A37 threonylcarbamoyladenosine dehydratase